MKSDRFRALLKQLSVLTNFWPAVLVVLAVGLALPRTIPVLKTLPERLILTEVNAAEEKPALPDPEEETEEKLEDSGNTYEDVFMGLVNEVNKALNNIQTHANNLSQAANEYAQAETERTSTVVNLDASAIF